MTAPLSVASLAGVFAVPPLPRRRDARRSLDFDAAECVARHIERGGITRLVYGGNAFLYDITLAEYEALLDWLGSFPATRWAIPALGPAFGRALDQAALLRRHRFPTAMLLPSGDPRDARGVEAGVRELADAAGMPLVLYLKSESAFGADMEAGLDAVGRLMHDGVAQAIKYAVVRPDPAHDPCLDGLLRRVDRSRVVSGIGERPAVVHMREFDLPGFTTGSGCLAPALCTALFEACRAQDWTRAEALRAPFIPHEDLRDAWGPARVLHHAIELAGIAPAGPIPPYVSPLDRPALKALRPVALALKEQAP